MDLLITNTGACILTVWEENSRGEAEDRPNITLEYGERIPSGDRCRVKSVKESQTREVLQCTRINFAAKFRPRISGNHSDLLKASDIVPSMCMSIENIPR